MVSLKNSLACRWSKSPVFPYVSFSFPPPRSSPHPVVLPGFLLFLGRHVRPDHVGAAAHAGWLRAKISRPRSLPRSVSLTLQHKANSELQASLSLFILAPVTCCHNNAPHWSYLLYWSVLKSVPVHQQQSLFESENAICNLRRTPMKAFVSTAGNILFLYSVCLLHAFVAGLVIRPNSLDLSFNKSDPLKYVQYVKHLESFLQSKCTFCRYANTFIIKRIERLME